MESISLQAGIRTETGKGPARRLRMKGQVPAVFYGRTAKATPLVINTTDITKILKEQKKNVFITLAIEGETKPRLSLIKDLQIDPLSRRLYHIDFYEISMDQKITLDVPLAFVGTPVGVQNGGELQHLKREVKISCLPKDIPDVLEIDISSLEIGHSLKVQDIKAPEGITIVDPGEVGVVAVAFTRVSTPQAASGESEATAPAEPSEQGD